ncbi:MAG: hypothetical protein WC989_00525 [Micavibrio sp.]
MKTRHMFLPALLCAAILFGAASPSRAQEESQTYDPTFTGRSNEAADYIRSMQRQSMQKQGFIKPDEVHVSLVRHDYMEDDQFGLQMAVPDVVSGCFEFSPLEYEANFNDPHYLDIKVIHYRRIEPQGGAQAGRCDRQNRMSTAIMVLSRSDLQKRGTQEIRFTADAGTDKYQILWNGSAIELRPLSMMVFKGRPLSGPLNDRIRLGFNGDSVVALHVPMAESGDDVDAQIHQFAMHRAMAPAQDGGNGDSGGRIYYFYDQGGHIASQIGEEGYGELGTIMISRPMDGPGGRKLVQKELRVFVTRPGTRL